MDTHAVNALRDLGEAEVQRRLDESRTRHGVPGATVGILMGDDLLVCASGVSRLPDGPPVMPGTRFLIASITKLWTATLVMRLVDEGRVDLDTPVNRYLDPPLRLADPDIARTVTVRHLLSHSGGFFGDAPEPPGRGDDAVREVVGGYAGLTAIHRPGTMFSYSNAGYNVLGRLVECLTGTTWDEALRERLIRPLGLDGTSTMPEEVMVHPFAVGHEPKKAGGPLSPVTTWLDPRGSGPSGGTLSTTAADLLAFARVHLRDGEGPDGRRVLSAESARAMRRPQIAQPDPGMSPAWGLGWSIERPAHPLVVEHGGNTCGQHSVLLAVPEHDLALCVLTNGDGQILLRGDLAGGLLRDLAGIDRPRTPDPAPPGSDVDPAPFVGSFSGSEDLRIDVSATDGELTAAFVTLGDVAGRLPSFTTSLTYAGGTTYLLTLPGMNVPVAVTFVREGGGEGAATHLALSLRLAPRVQPTPSLVEAVGGGVTA